MVRFGLIVFLLGINFLVTARSFDRGGGQDSSKVYEYEYCIARKAKPGQVIKNKKIGIADTNVCLVKCKILSKDEPTGYSSVFFLAASGVKYSVMADSSGQFELTIPAGKFTVGFYSLGHSNFEIKDFTLSSGQIQDLEVELGRGGGFVTYSIKSPKPLSKFQYLREEMYLKKMNQ